MTKATKDKINEFSKLLGSIVVILGIAASIAAPFVDDYIDKRVEEKLTGPSSMIYAKTYIDKYIHSAEFSVLIDMVFKDYEERDSQKVKLRTLLSSKMRIDEDEVHIELGRMYLNFKNKAK